mgnify:CR=1 FL=1
MGRVEGAPGDVAGTGREEEWRERMQDRSRLYELLRYDEYNEFDQGVFTYSRESYDPTA